MVVVVDSTLMEVAGTIRSATDLSIEERVSRSRSCALFSLLLFVPLYWHSLQLVIITTYLHSIILFQSPTPMPFANARRFDVNPTLLVLLDQNSHTLSRSRANSRMVLPFRALFLSLLDSYCDQRWTLLSAWQRSKLSKKNR